MKVGDPITLLVRRGGRYPISEHGFVQNLEAQLMLGEPVVAGAFNVLWGSERYQARRLFKREGIDWILGHHAPDSEACLAMRAAVALLREAPTPGMFMTVGFVGKSFLAGQISTKNEL